LTKNGPNVVQGTIKSKKEKRKNFKKKKNTRGEKKNTYLKVPEEGKKTVLQTGKKRKKIEGEDARASGGILGRFHLLKGFHHSGTPLGGESVGAKVMTKRQHQ